MTTSFIVFSANNALDRIAKKVKVKSPELFSEYGNISIAPVQSDYFHQKYKQYLIVEGIVASTNSPNIKALANKMGKTEKATYLLVKRCFSPLISPKEDKS